MERDTAFGKLVVVVLALTVLATLIDAAVARRRPVQEPEPRVLTVSADAYEEAEPDIAKVTVGVKVIRPTPKEAATKLTETVKAIKAKLSEVGVGQEAIDTSELYLGEATEYDYSKGRSVKLGYKAYHWLRVTIANKDFDKLPLAVDGAVAAGATTFSGLTWEMEDETSLQAAALAKATDRALQKAKAMARSVGAKIIGVQTISEDYGGDWDYSTAAAVGEEMADAEETDEPAAAMGEPAAEVDLEANVPGKLRISCKVRAEFLLE